MYKEVVYLHDTRKRVEPDFPKIITCSHVSAFAVGTLQRIPLI